MHAQGLKIEIDPQTTPTRTTPTRNHKHYLRLMKGPAEGSLLVDSLSVMRRAASAPKEQRTCTLRQPPVAPPRVSPVKTQAPHR